MPIWLMLWQKTHELRTGLPKPIGEFTPALSLIRKVRSRNTLAPRATEARNARSAGVRPGSSFGVSHGEYSLHTATPWLPSRPGAEAFSLPGPPSAPPASRSPPWASLSCAA